MILFNGPNTPFGRMALVTALELGLEVENRVVVVTTAAWLDPINPLRQIPTLIHDDGRAVFDSRVICAHFAALAPARDVVPSDSGIQTRWALGHGLMEAAVARQMGRLRPVGERSELAITRAETRIARVIQHLEAGAEHVCSDFWRIDRIATAVALDYIGFRYPHDGCQSAPRLDAWLAAVVELPSMAATQPREMHTTPRKPM